MTRKYPEFVYDSAMADLPHQPTTRDPTVDPQTELLRAQNAKDRRDRIAEGFAFALIAGHYGDPGQTVGCAISAIELADALIQELDK